MNYLLFLFHFIENIYYHIELNTLYPISIQGIIMVEVTLWFLLIFTGSDSTANVQEFSHPFSTQEKCVSYVNKLPTRRYISYSCQSATVFVPAGQSKKSSLSPIT